MDDDEFNNENDRQNFLTNNALNQLKINYGMKFRAQNRKKQN
jgi:hypothetical protein